MARQGPTTLSLPPFAGATRRLILWNIVAFFVLVLAGLVVPLLASQVAGLLMLQPAAVLHGQVWRLVTYSFMPLGLLGELFAMLTIWICGAMLEAERGSRWLYELYFVSVVGGALVATLLSLTHVFGLEPLRVAGAGCYAGIFGLLIAIARDFGEMEFLLFFLIRVKAKYMVAIYILIEIAVLLTGADRFDALVQLGGALCGFLFLQYVPRRGLASGVSEQYFGVRNWYYRAKRRRAAKKFSVYMGKQGRKVDFDKNGKYVEPEDRDPNDRRWMN